MNNLWFHCTNLMASGGVAIFVAWLGLGRAISVGDGVLAAAIAALGVGAITVATWAIVTAYADRGGARADKA